MKTILLFILCIGIFYGCGKQDLGGTLYTKDDIFLDCRKSNYAEALPIKYFIIEDEKHLKNALDKYEKLKEMPGFEEIMTKYSIKENVYVIYFFQTGYESETVSCEGIVIDKKNDRLWFKNKYYKDEDDISQDVTGYIEYAVFPKKELEGCNFSKQNNVIYPGN